MILVFTHGTVMYYFRFLGLLLTMSSLLFPVRANAQVERTVGFELTAFALTHAKVVTKPGTILENATVLIRDGLIEKVGTDLKNSL